MAGASYAVGDFRGGEISQFAQGRIDKPDYRTSLNVCLNAFPCEIGPWTRRPGTMFAGTTLNGAPGRVIEYKIEQQASITLEFTDGNLRFRSGPTLVGGTLATPYAGGSWASIRAVQAETTDILLAPTVAPQALVATTLPAPGVAPVFALNPAIFNDGPYLDPFTNGVLATPSAQSGIVTLSLSFQAWVSTTAYAFGAFVTASGVNYVSLADQNVGFTPASSTTKWATTSVAAAINGGKGFLGTDIGRLVRLFSEPQVWNAAVAYSIGATVSYNPTGQPGAATYYQVLVGSTGVAPGSDLTHWQIIPVGAAIWTWGKIVALSNIIDRALSGSTSIGNWTGGGGLNAAFNGSFSQPSTSGPAFGTTNTGFFAPLTPVSLVTFVGKNYTGASPQAVQQATVYPSSDIGFSTGTFVIAGTGFTFSVVITINLRGSATAPANSSAGTLLGSTGPLSNSFSAVTIVSNDQVTAWNYVWVEQVVTANTGAGFSTFWSLENSISQLSFFSPTGTGTNSGCNVEILGPPLLYTTAVVTWRMGVYSNTTGFPTCGVYNDGRLYLGGAVGNRFDASVSNGIVGGTVNFAPTDQYGNVPANSAISYTFNSNGVNPILWMKPDLQGIKCGTQEGEWLIQAPTAGPIAPANITARNVTNHGSANIQAIDTEHTVIFVQRFAKKLLEYFPDVFSGKFSAPNLADKAQHLTRAGVAELAYTSSANPIIWGRDTAGALFGITYKRDSLASSQPPTFYGWHRHALGSGRIVESICAGPSVGGDLDTLTMVTNDPATNIRHVEILTDAQDEMTPLAQSWFLDDAVVPTSVSLGATAATLSGLPYPDGKVVQVFCSGLDLGDPGEGKPPSDFTVAGGSITVPYGDGISVGPGRGLFTQKFASVTATGPFIVGFTYNSDGQLVRPMAPVDTGARNGPGFAKLSRAHRYGFKLINTLGLTVGTMFSKMRPANFKSLNGVGTPLPPLTTFTGISQGEPDDDDSYDRSLCWRVSRPFPANVVIAGVNLETKDQ